MGVKKGLMEERDGGVDESEAGSLPGCVGQTIPEKTFVTKILESKVPHKLQWCVMVSNSSDTPHKFQSP